jgi:hypothetical protein
MFLLSKVLLLPMLRLSFEDEIKQRFRYSRDDEGGWGVCEVVDLVELVVKID